MHNNLTNTASIEHGWSMLHLRTSLLQKQKLAAGTRNSTIRWQLHQGLPIDPLGFFLEDFLEGSGSSRLHLPQRPSGNISISRWNGINLPYGRRSKPEISYVMSKRGLSCPISISVTSGISARFRTNIGYCCVIRFKQFAKPMQWHAALH